LKTLGLATTPEQTESELMMSLIIDLNETAHQDQGMWMNWVDTNETIGELVDRTHGNTLLNIQCDEDENTSAQSDVNSLLSTKVVDVPRFELGASTMPR
jgi:hypothetical protein